MIFPIGDDQVEGGARPYVSYAFIVLNCLGFGLELSLSDQSLNQFLMEYGAIPAEIVNGQDLYTLLTSMFLHGGWLHLIGNMLFLWVFADNIEAVVGNFNFFLFYLLGGLAASAAHILVSPAAQIPAIGASGAISAVLGAYLVMFPASRVRVYVIYFFGSIKIPALFFLGIWIGQQLLYGLFSLDQAAAESSGVAWWAHIGGFAFGVVAGLLIRQYLRRQQNNSGRNYV